MSRVARHLAESRAAHPQGFAEYTTAARALCLVAGASSDGEDALRRIATPTLAPLAQGLSQLSPTLGLVDELPRPTGELDAYYEALLEFELADGPDGAAMVQASHSRRRGGAHYTPPELARDLVDRALAPLLGRASRPDDVLGLRVCDPAAGAGAFLLAVREALTAAVQRCGLEDAEQARVAVTRHCLCGVDQDPVAVWLARHRLAVQGVEPRLLVADALAPAGRAVRSPGAPTSQLPLDLRLAPEGPPPAFDWFDAFSEIFGRDNPGFDAVVGNPPWVAYVGRARQPLEPERQRWFLQHFSGFRGYRTLHGLFVEQGTRLLREGGRLGLLLPTSIADLDGYGPAREAHDAVCRVDEPLPDYGDRFEDVFQPCLGLLSTRGTARTAPGSPWPLERGDLDRVAQRLVARLSERGRCPPELFGEFGYQTESCDKPHLRALAEGELQPGECPLSTGSEVQEFRRMPARLKVDPRRLAHRFRPPEEWQRVPLWLRQTARFPICAPSDGSAFRNSIIAAFETERWPRFLLLAYLNASALRWYHYQSRRDARQGMPQLKVAHLRALPAPPERDSACGAALEELGRRLALANAGISADDRVALDTLVERYFDLEAEEVRSVRAWANANPPPQARNRSTEAG